MLFGHWVFDFVLQPHWMGLRKSKDWLVLTYHALRITLGALVVGGIIIGIHDFDDTRWWVVPAFGGVNGVSHFGIDAVTSRITSRLYAQGKTHGFFTVIGFDQFLHMSIAVLTLTWLMS